MKTSVFPNSPLLPEVDVDIMKRWHWRIVPQKKLGLENGQEKKLIMG